MKGLEKKSLEQKILKTAANLKVVDHRLPRSFEEKDSCLVPNSISTKTFKKGLTLHDLLCDAKPCARQQHSLSKSNKSRMEKRTLSQEHVDEKSKITFYQNLNSTLVSSSAVEHFEQSFSYERLVRPANFEDICSTSTNHHGSFGSAGCTPVKKMQWDEHNNAAEEGQCFGPMVEFGGCEAKGTPEKVELNESSETLVDDLNQQLTELKEKLTSANEKLGTVANQMDKTLNESFFGTERNEWANNESGNCMRDLTTNNKGLKGKSTQTTGSCKMRTECRDLMKKHIETLREHMKVRVFLLHAKRKGIPEVEKKKCHTKFKLLMEEFDDAKRIIKADFKRGNMDNRGMMAKHYLEIGQLQRETRILQAKLQQIFNGKNELRSPEYKSPPKPLRSPRCTDRFMAKFPHNSSREVSVSEEMSFKGEMLDELPNASQIGMLFDVSGASVEGFGMPEVCSAGVKARAEKTSHLQLDTNRMLLAQFVYDHLNLWPTPEMLVNTDLEVITDVPI